MADYIIPPIRNLIVLLTNQCNLTCPYCFESRNAQRMSLDTAKDVLHFLCNNSNNPSMTFFGGEPMLEWDTIMVPLIEYAKGLDKKVRFGMTTNGTLLNKERMDYLIDNNVAFMLSMDGNKCTQDCSRPSKNGESSFDKIEAIFPYILEKRPYQVVRATLTEQNVKNLYENILWFEEFGVKNFAVLPNVFECLTDNYKEILMKQILLYEKHIIDSFRENKEPLLVREYGQSFWRILSTLESTSRRDLLQCAAEKQCGFGVKGGASCDVFGNIYGCHHIELLPVAGSYEHPVLRYHLHYIAWDFVGSNLPVPLHSGTLILRECRCLLRLIYLLRLLDCHCRSNCLLGCCLLGCCCLRNCRRNLWHHLGKFCHTFNAAIPHPFPERGKCLLGRIYCLPPELAGNWKEFCPLLVNSFSVCDIVLG